MNEDANNEDANPIEVEILFGGETQQDECN